MVKPCNTLAELKEEILAAGDKLVVIAEWCPTCRMMSQEIEKLATEEKDVMFLGVHVYTEASKHFYINALPTFILIKVGHIIIVVEESIGRKILVKGPRNLCFEILNQVGIIN